MTKQIVVIGGGPAGVEAARAAARAGGEVTLVHDAPIGGRAGWHSLLPSKVWLTAADTLGLLREVDALGIETAGARLNAPGVVQRIDVVRRAWAERQKTMLEQFGVTRVPGTAVFTAPDTIDVRDGENKTIATHPADAFIVSAGSVPHFPEGFKPDGERVLAPRFAGHLDALPRSIIVIGAGATGCEFAYFFNRAGVDVTWIVDEFGVLPQFQADVGRALGRALVRQGVGMVQGQMVDYLERERDGVVAVLLDGARYEAETASVAIGRVPDWDRLNFEAAGLTTIEGLIARDEFGRTQGNERIYLVGDADGGWMVANKAMMQARIAARHAAGVLMRPYEAAGIILATYTEPQAAQVGDVRVREEVHTVRVPFHAALKAHLLPESEGFVQLHFHEQSREVVGGLAVGPHAADVLAPVALALNVGATIDHLADTYAAHPTWSELAFLAARHA